MDLSAPKWYQDPNVFSSNGETSMEADPSSFYGGSRSSGNPFMETFPADPLCKLNLNETSEFVKSLPTAAATTTPTETRSILEISSAHRRRDGHGVSSAMTQHRRPEPPSTPGRPVFSFSVNSSSNNNSSSSNMSRKSFPSKWDDAEKWVMSGSSSYQSSPAHALRPLDSSRACKGSNAVAVGGSKHGNGNGNINSSSNTIEAFAEKSRVTTEEAVSVSSKMVSDFQGILSLSLDHEMKNSATALNGAVVVSPPSAHVLLKDKFTDDAETIVPKFRCADPPSKAGFLFRSSATASREGEEAALKDAVGGIHEVHHRDVGTEMTPLGSSTNSRCPTPYKITSPPRHNTPANRSGPLDPEASLYDSNGCTATIDIAQLKECHFAKLQLGTQFDSIASNWSSREEEEEEVSKSLRHFETNGYNNFSGSNSGNETGYEKCCPESRAAAWEEEEKLKCCLRYQREEAKIQAWVNLESAKAEAQSRKLEVKIQKMRSNLEEKLMKRMAIVHRKAEEWRAEAMHHYTDQLHKASGPAKRKTMMKPPDSHFFGYASCGCLPCTYLH